MKLLLSLVAGAISAFAFQPFGLWPLMPLAFVALLELLNRTQRLRGALALGWSFGVGQYVVGFNWIATAFTYQAAMPAWLGWIAVVLLSLYLAVYPALATGLAWRIGHRRLLPLALSLAGAWAITEWLRARMFTGFAWNPVGVTGLDWGIAGAAPAVGTYGVSAMIVLAAGALWLLSQRDWKPAVGIGAGLQLAALATLMVNVPANDLLKPVRIVQPNIGQEDKWRPGSADPAPPRLASLSAAATSEAPPRLLLWPEVAFVDPIEVLDQEQRPLEVPLPAVPRSAATLREGELLLTGAIALTVDQTGTVVGNTNSVYAMDARGRLLGRYDKAHLVPYGEYLPMRPLLSAIGLSQLAPGQGDTSSGSGPRTLELGIWGRVGLQICYEIIFSGEVVDRRNRPDFIFNPSNDAWFGRWGPPQHLAQARLRAAEEGLPVLRSTPTGISAVIDAKGRLLHSLPWRTAGVIDAVLPQPAPPTLFARFGNVIPLALGFLLVIAGIALARGGRYRRKT